MKTHSATLFVIIAGVAIAIAILLVFLIGVPEINNLQNSDDQKSSGNVENLPVYITTMTHYEGNWNIDEGFFERIIERSEFGMDIADDYQAKLTFESERPFAIASKEFNRNFLQEILNRGHGVGTHCDFGLNDAISSFVAYVTRAKQNKELVDDLIGKKNNLGCSGGSGEWDWAIGLSEAGFSYVDGIVGAHYLSMEESKRPDGWTDEYIYDQGYHLEAPLELEERIYPIWLNDAQDFEEDEAGTLAMMGGSLGRISILEEGREDSCLSNDSCELTKADVDIAIALIQEVLEIRDPERFAKIIFYIPTSDLVEENEEVLHYFFEQVAEFGNDLKWATQKEAYEDFVEFSK